MRMRIAAAVLSIATGLGLFVPASSAAGPAPAPCTFSPAAAPASRGYSADERADPFATVAPRDHIGVLDGFSQITEQTRLQNLAETVAVDNTASSTTVRDAIDDNYDINQPAIFDALGSRLAPAFVDALAAGSLPKVSQLLLGKDALVGPRLDTTAEKKHFHNLRPFEVAPALIRHYSDGRPDLYDSVRGSGSYPSGHTTWGYSQAFLIAAMLPELGPQILARGAEYGFHRVVLGVHYPLDVIGGRMQAEATVAQLLGDSRFDALLAGARREIRDVLSARVGAPIAEIVRCQNPYQPTGPALETYRSRETFSFQPVGDAERAVEVPAGAENLIRSAHPGFSDAQLRALLAKTALPASYPLDKTGPDGGWQRLDIARAWVAS